MDSMYVCMYVCMVVVVSLFMYVKEPYMIGRAHGTVLVWVLVSSRCGRVVDVESLLVVAGEVGRLDLQVVAAAAADHCLRDAGPVPAAVRGGQVRP